MHAEAYEPGHKTLPQDENDALTFIYLYGTQDTLQYLAMTDAFISQHPAVATGYTMKAEMLCAQGKHDAAASTYQNALKVKGIAQNQNTITMVCSWHSTVGRRSTPRGS